MIRHKWFVIGALILLPLGTLQGRSHSSFSHATLAPAHQLNGRWRVKFVMSGVEKNLIFEAKAKGSGVFMLLDTGPDDRPVTTPISAGWSQLTNERVSISSEVELPLGTCCREWGTLIFKGKFSSPDTISGRLIFVTSIDEEESPYQFHSLVGTFTASRVRN